MHPSQFLRKLVGPVRIHDSIEVSTCLNDRHCSGALPRGGFAVKDRQRLYPTERQDADSSSGDTTQIDGSEICRPCTLAATQRLDTVQNHSDRGHSASFFNARLRDPVITPEVSIHNRDLHHQKVMCQEEHEREKERER